MINQRVFKKNLIIKSLIKRNYGLGSFFFFKLLLRFEVFEAFNFLNDHARWVMLCSFFSSFRLKNKLKNNFCINIVLLDFNSSYKGVRHIKGYPVRGQRTWSNSWSSYKVNTQLRQLRVGWTQKYYGGVTSKEAKVLLMAELVNYYWWLNWRRSWRVASKLRENQIRRARKKNKALSTLNFQQIGFNHVFMPILQRDLTKRQKAVLKSSSFLTGYRPYFTIRLFRELVETKRIYNISRGFSYVSRFSTPQKIRTIKKKKIDIKLKKKKHILKKKKKKSVWA